jgi:hypothetical protein
MNMLAPDRAISLVELVIMAGDIGGGLGHARNDHRASLNMASGVPSRAD